MLAKTKVFIFLTYLSASSSLSAATKADKTLPDIDELHAVPTVLRSSSGVVRENDSLYLFGLKLDQYVKIPFHPDGKTRAARFGEYIQSTRIDVPKTHYPGDWRGMMSFDDGRRMLWDASMLQLVLFFPEKNKIIQEATVPIDTLKPPRDRQGEPTSVETAKARKQISSTYRKVFGSRFSGLSSLPTGWIEGKKNYYAMSTIIKGFPLLIMGCAEGDPTACTIDRFCYIEGGPKIKPKNTHGVAASADGKLLLMGDAGANAIHVYHWDSCFNVRFLRTLKLPAKIKKLTSLHIDEDENLWVTTNEWENNFDSNLYYWEPKQWR